MLREDRYALGHRERVVKLSETAAETPSMPTTLRSLGERVDQAAELLERERELERISRALRDAVDGVGSVLLVEGPAGIGKTTLALAAGAQGHSRGARLLRAAGRELERDFPYGVVRQLFDPVLRAAAPAHREHLLEGAGGAAAALHLASNEA